jgi:RNA polymerase sigma factor (sigma-70 family)
VTVDPGTEHLLRALAPRVLGAVVRRYGHFDDAEDAVQEALLAAATTWPTKGRPEQPMAWLIRVASRRMADRYRADEARRRREVLAASWSASPPEAAAGQDDTLILFFMCCHPDLSPPSAIALTLRAVGGLTTREIATAFFVPESTMAQRISRAKATVAHSALPFALPSADEQAARLHAVLHVLYLVFNEGYVTSGGAELVRTDLTGEAMRLVRLIHESLPASPEVAGLLALMLLTDARRPARTGPSGELIPLAEQDRTLWDRALITEGTILLTAAMRAGPMGEYQAQAAIAALHAQGSSHETTNWPDIVALYDVLARLHDNPMVALNRAVAVAMAQGPSAGLASLEALEPQLGAHYRFHAVRAHLLERAGQKEGARADYAKAAEGTLNLPERHYLTKRAAALAAASSAQGS